VGAFDAHMGAVGGGITNATLVKIMGTSTCDIMVAPVELVGNKLIRGICGQVEGSVIPGMVGLEAGQSAFGDVYAWFKKILSWPLGMLLDERIVADPMTNGIPLFTKLDGLILKRLSSEAAELSVEETGVLALDWLNGRRTPDADQTLKGAMIGLSLGTTPAKIFRALVEATAFGAKAIVDRFEREGIRIEQVIAMGGIATKNEFVMQVTADVFDMPIKIVRSEQACALGAGMFGAVAAGLYETVGDAQTAMGSGFSKTYYPNPDNTRKYHSLYPMYLSTGKILEEHLRIM
jgi:L-ribulokinase